MCFRKANQETLLLILKENTILTLVYTFIELAAHVLLRPVCWTKDPDPYPLANGGQN